MDEVKADRKLKGKINFISWKREFERAAKANDTFEYLTGEEVVPPKPRKEDYFTKTGEAEIRRSTRTKKISTPTVDDGDETDDAQAILVTTNNNLRWQIDYNEHKNAREKMKLATKLLDTWVSDGIKIEIEDCTNAKEAYDFIKKRYAVTHERARDSLLNQLSLIKLDDCLSVTDYTNKVHQVKADLKTVKYDMTDDMFATALLHGLPPSYRAFKEKYDWIRSTKPDDPPDLDYLYERLHVEEAQQLRLREERRARERARKDTSVDAGNRGYSGRYKPSRADKSHLKCTYPDCGKTGHTEETCWVKSPEKIPRSLKDRLPTHIDNKPMSEKAGMAGVVKTDPVPDRDVSIRADSLGTTPFSTTHVNSADSSPQKRSAVLCTELRELGGATTRGSGIRKLSFSERVLGAFLTGTFCTTDTWLADTGANMHIVNDIKWFKDNTFRSFNSNISTADGSTTLEIKGGGVVQLILKSPDGFPVKVSLSEVAYAPQGKCNLFSGGLFVQKAKVTGVYNDRYMTWINDHGHTIGHAIFGKGLYQLDATRLSKGHDPIDGIAATVDFDDPVWKWHRRLGHLGFQNMLSLLDSSTGMEITAKQIKAKLKAVCPICATTRALVKIPHVAVSSNIPSEDENDYSSDAGSDHSEDEHHINTPEIPVEQTNQTAARNKGNVPNDGEQPISEMTHESEDGVDDSDDEDEASETKSGSRVVSKYWNRFSYAGMAKRKIDEDTLVAPKNSRRATHDLRGTNKDDSSSDLSDLNDDSWYYSEDGAISQAYWRFYSLRTAVDRNGSEDYSRSSHAEGASRQAAAVFFLTLISNSVRDVKSQTYGVTGAWTVQGDQPPVKKREKLSDRQDMKNLDSSQCLVTRNAPDAPRKSWLAMEKSRATGATLYSSVYRVDHRALTICLHAINAVTELRLEVGKSVTVDDPVRRASTESQHAVTEPRTVC
ncbi:hypothetical protein N7532_002196 [Penicillium argentinense]|uniref:GAG-pre-integrase domain-containing protein n=1 Tax=Penicillium argentinense TaxID=1131581 RepID=A0A9W9G003_9EURO|nr:uncharacterized protein N7532_002196 [Penicillium argentinense]KAJ5109551.1 hypothetical protein N7532_002196 [Penicillium argentinense]